MRSSRLFADGRIGQTWLTFLNIPLRQQRFTRGGGKFSGNIWSGSSLAFPNVLQSIRTSRNRHHRQIVLSSWRLESLESERSVVTNNDFLQSWTCPNGVDRSALSGLTDPCQTLLLLSLDSAESSTLLSESVWNERPTFVGSAVLKNWISKSC